MVAYRRRYCGNIGCRKAKIVKNTESHYRAALRVVDAVDKITYIMQITGDLHELYVMLRIAERFKYVPCRVRDLGDMRKAVLGISESR